MSAGGRFAPTHAGELLVRMRMRTGLWTTGDRRQRSSQQMVGTSDYFSREKCKIVLDETGLCWRNLIEFPNEGDRMMFEICNGGERSDLEPSHHSTATTAIRLGSDGRNLRVRSWQLAGPARRFLGEPSQRRSAVEAHQADCGLLWYWNPSKGPAPGRAL